MLISHILVFLLLANTQAENTRRIKSLRDLIELEFEMLKSTKLLVKDENVQLKEILINEKLVELYCFEDDLDDQELKTCEKHIKNLKKLHPNNVFIKCYELENIDDCKEAFKKEVVLSVDDIEELEKKNKFIKNIWDKEQSFIDLRLKLEQYRTKEDGRGLLADIKNLKQELESSEDKNKTINSINENYKKAIYSLCRTSKVIYAKDVENYNRNFLYFKSQKNNSDETNALIKSIEELKTGFNPEVKKKEDENKLTRVKILTKDCLKVLEDSYDFNPNIAEVYCFLESFSSPSCKKFENKFKNKKVKKNKKLNLSSF